jgi:hypothetical protein
MSRVACIAIASLGVAACCDGPNGVESPGDKREWSILQSIEFQTRASIPTSPELRTDAGYDLLSVRSSDGSKRIWIMLWPKSLPYYKQLPDGNFALPKTLFDELERSRKVSNTVLVALSGHVEK